MKAYSKQTDKRLINLDILKIISMYMIIVLHYFHFGGVLDNVTLQHLSFVPVWFLEMMAMVSVNCFILSSGYLMKKNNFRLSKLFNIWLQVFFINALCYAFSVITGVNAFSAKEIVSLFFPVILGKYWYVTAYVIFYCLSPLLIKIVDNASLKELRIIAVTGVLLFAVVPRDWANIAGGCHFVWFTVLFFVAAYIRKAGVFKKSSAVYFALYLIITAVSVLLKVLSVKYSSKLFSLADGYNSVMVFASSVMFFAAFKNIKIKNNSAAKFTAVFASLTLGIYLIHLNPYIVYWFWGDVISSKDYIDKPEFVLNFILVIPAVYIACSLLEYIRQLLFKLCRIPKLSLKLEQLVKTAAGKIDKTNMLEKI